MFNHVFVNEVKRSGKTPVLQKEEPLNRRAAHAAREDEKESSNADGYIIENIKKARERARTTGVML